MKNMDMVDPKAEPSETTMMLQICHHSTGVGEAQGVGEVEVDEAVRRVLVLRDQANNVACNKESSHLENLLRWFLETLRRQLG